MGKVDVRFQKNLEHEIKVRSHVFISDEPKDVGGNDKGPTPYELLMAGLGACTSMTMLMYARKKGWDISDIQIELENEKIHAEDCEKCATQTGRLDKITRNIKIRGNLNEEQKTKLIEIAWKCPVHRTLTNENLIIDNIELVP